MLYCPNTFEGCANELMVFTRMFNNWKNINE